MPIRTRLLHTTALAVTLALAAPAIAEEASGPNLELAWRDASMGLVIEARQAFSQAEGREARFGEAITLLLTQPKTDANIERAAQLLNKIIEQNPTDTQGIIARYHLGRLEQAHRTPANLEAAAAHYRQLRKTAPNHPLAEEALVKLGIIELYAPSLTDEARLKLHRHYAAQANQLTSNSARRDLHFLLAQVAQRYRFSKTLTLDHYLAADKEGILRTATRADVYVSILTLARDLNRPALARQYCDRFLAEYLRDNRRYMIEEIKRELP
ncbi:tetratricopeptide repeat protein, partial [Geminisphaera colitermitum]|uniref:tetratricopeptide repeat protein n=1 Tax=Geminisphaera colitermitum TaxID=1148786 RepID=UPI0005BADF60